MPTLSVGSAEHKALFCREFVDTFHSYEVRDVRWPELTPDDLTRLRALPFWAEAVSSERTAGARVHAMAEAEPDPVLREAIAMQAYEEGRHAELLESMLAHYEISVPDGGGERRQRGLGRLGRHSPRYALRTCSLPSSSAPLPTSTTRPFSST